MCEYCGCQAVTAIDDLPGRLIATLELLREQTRTSARAAWSE